MRIKRLDIMGFKSFPERVQVPFSPGISAIVGPNGCGKSNIVDSIRWVMGEQSPRQLRGRQMDDILFNGARTHQAAGLAEVTMVLANEGASGPGPSLGPSEISITRRLFRSGDSEYLINKVPCRLKDIVQFFMDTGMGTKAYAIIEQGRIGWLVDARPEDRRALIDEAAGITRYKAQKREAERKIEATEQNLTHISTLMSETKRQINSLNRQANKAVRFKELKTELKRLDLALTARKRETLEADRRSLNARKEEKQAALSALLTDLERMEIELENGRLTILEQEKIAQAKAEYLYGLQNQANQLRQEDQFLQQQYEKNQEREKKLGDELARLKEESELKGVELERLKVEMASWAEKVEDKQTVLDEIRASATRRKEAFQRITGERDEAQKACAQLQTRAGRLEEILAGHDRMIENTRQRSDEAGEEAARLTEESADLAGRESQLEKNRQDLADRMEEIERETAALRSETSERREEAGRLAEESSRLEAQVAALSSRLNTLKDVQANFGWYPEGVGAIMGSAELREAGVMGPVAEMLDLPTGYEDAVEAALGEKLQFILVRNRDAGLKALDFLKKNNLGRCGFISLAGLGPKAEADLTRALLGDYTLVETLSQIDSAPPDRSVLTREGDFVGADGLVVGGRAQESGPGLLNQLRELEDLTRRVEAAAGEKGRIDALRSEVERRIQGLARSQTGLEETTRTTRNALVDVEKQMLSVTGRRSQVEGRLSALRRDLEGLAGETNRLSSEKESARAEISALKEKESVLTAGLEALNRKIEDQSLEIERIREREKAAHLEAGSLGERLKNGRREQAQATQWLEYIREQTESKSREREQVRVEIDQRQVRREEIAVSLSGLNEQVVQAQEEAAGEKKKLDTVRSEHNEKESAARQSRRQRSSLEDDIRKLEVDLTEVGYRIQRLIDRIETEYHLDLLNLPAADRPSPNPDLDPDQAEKDREELKKKIESMGEVNLTAITEHEALIERYDFYKNQYEDLNRAIDNLKTSIARINRTCKIRFKSTFEAVDQKLREIFPLLFEGGEAWLSLTDDSDPLDSGVEIHVHPPGKKLTVMSLLSGGEKALVALALIFALYLIKPSPFCLLDETDAPLDEANIDRFNRLLTRLGQSSQIIMVTHNKRTMQISSTLYGVTMEEPGVSKMVSVDLSDLEELERNAQMVQAG